MSRGKSRSRFVLILGGARSGKSSLALRLAETWWTHPLYLATAEVTDREMEQRIALHRRARGAHWLCHEEPLDVAAVVRRPPRGCDGVLMDCVTIWLSNALLREGEKGVERRKADLLHALQNAPRDVILVSNEVGLGIVPASKLGRQFRDLAGWVNQDLAAQADAVVFVAAGLPLVMKGRIEFPSAAPTAKRKPGERRRKAARTAATARPARRR